MGLVISCTICLFLSIAFFLPLLFLLCIEYAFPHICGNRKPFRLLVRVFLVLIGGLSTHTDQISEHFIENVHPCGSPR